MRTSTAASPLAGSVQSTLTKMPRRRDGGQSTAIGSNRIIRRLPASATSGSDPMDPRVAELSRLLGIVDRLREECPWDREQTLATMAPCAQEEAAEVADAVAGGVDEAICEELGDLLMNVFLMGRIAEKGGSFSLADIARRIGEKLVHRHPHVFGDASARTSEQVLSQWDRIKEAEK